MPRAKSSNAKKSRNHLEPQEVRLLLEAAKLYGRHAHRNFTLILLGYRHGLKLGELNGLRWRDVDLSKKTLRIARRRRKTASIHPLRKDEAAALRQLKRNYPNSSYLFVNDRGSQLTERSVNRIVTEAGEAAGLKIPVTPRTLRRSCVRNLALAGNNLLAVQHFLGYDNVGRVLRYLELPKQPFKDFWKSEPEL